MMKKVLTSLQTEILLSLTLLLVVAMGLTGFIVFQVWERDLFRDKAAEGQAFISRLQRVLDGLPRGRTQPPIQHLRKELDDGIEWVSSKEDLKHAVVVGKNGSAWIGDRKNLIPIAFEFFDAAQGEKRPPLQMQKKGHLLLVAGPLFRGKQTVAVAQVPVRIDLTLKALARSRNLVWFYIGLNVVVVLLFGTHLLSRIVIRPIRRLMKTANHFEETDDFSFGPDTERNEIARLTRALNRMLKRLAENKDRMTDQITSLEQANKDLKEAREVVLRSEKLSSLGRLAAGVAHEVGNPLGVILGYTELIKKKVESDPKTRDYLDRMEGEITRIHTLIKDLLDYSRPSGDALGPVDINHLIGEAVTLFATQKSSSNIEISTALSPDAGLVTANGPRLKQVLINLLFNACDAVTDGGTVVVSTAQIPAPGGETTGAVKMTVSDTGAGIPESHLDKIFDPFYTTKPPGKGTGLGLSVSLRIIASFGGTLGVQSEEKKGTTFTTTLKPWTGKHDAK